MLRGLKCYAMKKGLLQKGPFCWLNIQQTGNIRKADIQIIKDTDFNGGIKAVCHLDKITLKIVDGYRKTAGFPA